MFVHIMHAPLTGSQTLNSVSSDTNVVDQDIAGYADLNIYALWIAFGKINYF